MFYTYLWLREDGTPYYVGKGCNGRAFRKGAPPFCRIIIQEFEKESDAIFSERFLIDYFGLIVNGGCLENKIDRSGPNKGLKMQDEQRQKISNSKAGNSPAWNKGKRWSAAMKLKIGNAIRAAVDEEFKKNCAINGRKGAQVRWGVKPC